MGFMPTSWRFKDLKPSFNAVLHVITNHFAAETGWISLCSLKLFATAPTEVDATQFQLCDRTMFQDISIVLVLVMVALVRFCSVFLKKRVVSYTSSWSNLLCF